MTHGDDDGIILPPRVASAHVVLMPIVRKDKDKPKVMEFVDCLARELREKYYHHRRLVVEVDRRDIGGARGWDWIKKGIPLRVEIGPRDIEDNAVYVGRRDKPHTEKVSIKRDHFLTEITNIMDEIQNNLFQRARTFHDENSVAIDNHKEFYDYFTPQNEAKPEIHGGFALSSWCSSDTCESKIKDDLGVTIRCIPLDGDNKSGTCICCGKPSRGSVVFAKAY
jgi:prolyl-tRNA synthetase